MLWQDIVITIASIIFSISLFPQVYLGFKNKKGYITFATYIPTFIGLYVVCVTYFTLGLFLSAVMCFITGTIWLILFFQRLIFGKT